MIIQTIKRILGILEVVLTKIILKLCKFFHIPITERKIESLIQFIKFGFVGVSNTFISYITYIICITLGLHYLMGSILGFAISVLNSYFWNSKYVFKDGYKEYRAKISSFLKMVATYGITGLLLNNILLVIMVEYLRVSEYIAPIIILFITIPLNFILNKLWAFRNN